MSTPTRDPIVESLEARVGRTEQLTAEHGGQLRTVTTMIDDIGRQLAQTHEIMQQGFRDLRTETQQPKGQILSIIGLVVMIVGMIGGLAINQAKTEARLEERKTWLVRNFDMNEAHSRERSATQARELNAHRADMLRLQDDLKVLEDILIELRRED